MTDRIRSQSVEIADVFFARFNGHRPTSDHAGIVAAAVANGEPSPPTPPDQLPVPFDAEQVAIVSGRVRGYYSRPGEAGAAAAEAAIRLLFACQADMILPVARPTAPPLKRKRKP